MSLRYPAPLQPGDRIGVTAPSSGVPAALRGRLNVAVEQLHDRGYDVVVGRCIDGAGIVSASARKRADELGRMLADPDIRAVVPPWGGELAVEVLPHLEWDALRAAEHGTAVPDHHVPQSRSAAAVSAAGHRVQLAGSRTIVRSVLAGVSPTDEVGALPKDSDGVQIEVGLLERSGTSLSTADWASEQEPGVVGQVDARWQPDDREDDVADRPLALNRSAIAADAALAIQARGRCRSRPTTTAAATAVFR